MRLAELLDPYALTLRLTNANSPWLAKLFGGRPELANFGHPVHDEIFSEVEAWRACWMKGSETNEFKRLTSYALAAGRCRDELLRRQMGAGYVRFERVFFVGVSLLTAVLVAANTGFSILRRSRRGKVRAEVVCFPANRTVKATAAKLMSDADILHLSKFGYYLSWDALRFLVVTLARFPRLLANPRLTSSFLRLLAQYSHVVVHHHPKVIIGYFDGTSSVSLLTAYLRRQQIAHYNVMHGEVFYSTDHSTYVEVDRFYVWGQYYKEILLRQRCPAPQFRLLASPALAELFNRHRPRNQPRERRLLLLHEPYLELSPRVYQGMLHLLSSLDESWEVTVRFHPAFRGNIDEFVAALRARLPACIQSRPITVESPFEITPPETLVRHRVVVSCVSTMLLEGWLAGCKSIYFSGFLRDELFHERYGSSKNVLILSPETPTEVLRDFLDTPAILDASETKRANHVVNVCAATE